MRLRIFSLLVAAALISSAPSLSLGQEYRPDATTAPSTSEGYNSETGSSNPGGSVDTNTNTDTSSPGGTVDTTPPGYVTEPTPATPATPTPGYTTPDSSSPSYTTPDTTSPSYREPESSPGGYVGDKETDRGRAWNYMVFKAGAYFPSQSYDVDNIATINSGRVHFNNRVGIAGEIAYGRYILPVLAIELGAGYFQSRGVATDQTGRTMLRVVPVVATGKFFLPLGAFEPYALGGIGAYISDLDIKGSIVGNFSGTTEVTYGLHAGAGFNINFTDRAFAGLEGKYLWAEPSFGGRHIRLDGFITTLNVGFRF